MCFPMLDTAGYYFLLVILDRFGPKLWNAFPENLCSIPRRSLNKKIHALLLNLLYSEDAYPSKQIVIAKLIAGFQYGFQ